MKTPSLGIDIAKLTFDAALRFDRQRCLKARFANNRSGFQQLYRWLKTHCAAGSALRVAVESTSTYAEALVEWLDAKRCCVFLLNPERVAHYGRCCGQRNHTDSADAALLAAFIAQHDDLTPWQPPPPEQKDLRSLTRARAQVVATTTSLQLQVQTATGPARPHLQALLQAARRTLALLGQAITAQLKAHAHLWAQARRLMTIKGLGLITAAVMVAELPPITAATDPRTICAWCGLTPRRSQSGPREWTTRLSRKGNAYLRQALYMPALVAKRYNPLLRAFAQRLAQNGKSNGAILGALSHKMLRIAVGLLRSQQDFDPNWHLPKI